MIAAQRDGIGLAKGVAPGGSTNCRKSSNRQIAAGLGVGHKTVGAVRWDEHKALIEAGQWRGAETFEAFWPGKWRKVVATMAPPPRGAGYSLIFPNETTIREDGRLVILLKREGEDVGR